MGDRMIQFIHNFLSANDWTTGEVVIVCAITFVFGRATAKR